MSNIFNDDDESQDFRDIPDEVIEGNSAPVPNVRVNRPAVPPQPAQQVKPQPEPVYEDPVDNELEETEDEEQDFASILSDARQRMEQGRIYEVLMDHDLFSGQGFDEKAVKFVTRQIRNFAKEQMEIMLGMRQETPKKALTASDFPFNDIEVAALKDLAYMATKGQSAAPEAQQFSGVAAPVVPRKAGINAISRPATKPVAKPLAPAKPSAPKPLAQKPAAPVQRQQVQKQNEEEILTLCMELGISREEYDRQYSSFSSALTKPMSQMNEDEIKERNRQIALRSGAKAKSPAAIPMPSAEQEEMLHTQRANTAASNPQMQLLMAALTKKK